jgi:hypothetical protein
MTKPPNKGGTERLATPTIKIPPRTHYQTRATTQSTGNSKPTTMLGGIASAPPKGMQSSRGKEAKPGKVMTNDSNKLRLTMLQIVA